MVAGNQPLLTKTAPIYIFGEIESGNRHGALVVSAVLLASSLVDPRRPQRAAAHGEGGPWQLTSSRTAVGRAAAPRALGRPAAASCRGPLAADRGRAGLVRDPDPGPRPGAGRGRSWPAGCARSSTALPEPEVHRAFAMSLGITAIATVVNTVFGVALALVLVRQRFWGRALVDGMVDMPFAISPIVAGLMLVVLYGPDGWLGRWLEPTGSGSSTRVPGMILATMFVTVPFVVRELVPVLRELGEEYEQAAHTLGAGRWRTFWSVTLPSIRWGVAYGVTLTIARSLGRVRRGAGGLGQRHRPHPDGHALHLGRSRELPPRGGLRRQPGPRRGLVRPARGDGTFPQASRKRQGGSIMSVAELERKRGRRPQAPSRRRARPEQATSSRDRAAVREAQENAVGIEVRNLSKKYGSFQAVEDVSFEVPGRPARRAAGPVGLGQEHHPADHRRAGAGRLRQRRCSPARTPRGSPCSSAGSASCSSTTPCSAT